MAAIRRASMRANCASHSCWSGLSISAAAVGVGARCTVAGLFEIFNDDLIIAAPFVQADTGARQHMQAILERDAEQAPMLAKEGAAYLRLGVLEREVDMARGGKDWKPRPRSRSAGIPPPAAPWPRGSGARPCRHRETAWRQGRVVPFPEHNRIHGKYKG